MDKVLFNGEVITLDRTGTRAEAVAVKNGKIAMVGSNEQIKQLVTSETELIDLKGKTLLPGFIEAHNHMISFGTNLREINCQDGTLKSIAEVLTEVKKITQKRPPGSWIKGWGYDDTRFAEKRYPNRWELDQVAPEHPVAMLRTCGHMLVANTKALKMAGIDRNTIDPYGGQIVRNGNGEPTGLLLETAQDLVKKVITVPSVDELCQSLELASKQYNSEGITSVHEAGAGFNFPGPHEVRAYQQAASENQLSVRVYMMLYTELLEELAEIGLHTGFGNELLKIGCYKLFTDGGFGGKTAALEEPYEGSSNKGIIYGTFEEIYTKMRKAHDAGFQIAIHAIGDRAVKLVLDSYERIFREAPKENHRHRIEHFGLINFETITRAKELNLIPVPQPPFTYYLGDSFISNLGKERANKAYPLKSMLDAGLKAAGSSDRPVVPGAPLKGIQAAVLRTTADGEVINAQERITVERALRMYTNHGAYASFEEGIKGSIEAGKLADLVVLGANPLKVKHEEISDIPVEMTVFGGRIVFQR